MTGMTHSTNEHNTAMLKVLDLIEIWVENTDNTATITETIHQVYRKGDNATGRLFKVGLRVKGEYVKLISDMEIGSIAIQLNNYLVKAGYKSPTDTP
jgi:hypothetical protein